MDSNRIKNLAIGVRDALRAEASARLDAVLAEGSRERLEAPQLVSAVEADVHDHGREEVVDRSAYTWFNRLCALRFMDANGYTPVGVVTPRAGSTQPAILADAAQGAFDPEWGISEAARQRVAGLLLGDVPSANPSEDAYAELLRAVCARYADPMGYLFAEDVASSLLMPQGLLAQRSILTRIVAELDAEACSSVEVLGWLYQFYIAERKDEYFASKKKATAEDIPAATQLFTPEWIVRYLTENSLGRLWMLNNPGSELAGSMDYYVAPEGDEPHVEVVAADEIRVLDPACGSGHILVYAFDLLFRMYEEEGWPTEDIPQMILENNLFGLEIDRRAAEIASFALEMKARERDPRWLSRQVDADIHVLEPVSFEPQELELVPQLAQLTGLLDAMAHLDEVGSLYAPDPLDEFVLRNELEHVTHDGSLFAESVIAKLKAMLTNVQALGRSFHCVIANPPYMGSSNMNPWMNVWIRKQYPNEKADLCTCFINRSFRYAKDGGYTSLVTMQAWMFIGSYESMRKSMLSGKSIVTMAHLGTHAFDAIGGGEVVSTTAAVYSNRPWKYRGVFIDLTDFDSERHKSSALKNALVHPGNRIYKALSKDFSHVPGNPLAYWMTSSEKEAFAEWPVLGECGRTSIGIKTGNNDLFLRLWWEVSINDCCLAASSAKEAEESGKKWFAINKGGPYRKWYGNSTYVVDWRDHGRHFFRTSLSLGHHPQEYDDALKFRPYVTWSDISSGDPAFRVRDQELSETTGMGFYPNSGQASVFAGFLNSTTAASFLRILSPTIHLKLQELEAMPWAGEALPIEAVTNHVEECVDICRKDWDSFEESWGFIRHPLTQLVDGSNSRLASAYDLWESECRERFDRLKANEEELNRIFARIYHMEGEVPVEVPDDKVSVRLADRARDARSLVSYIIGCLFGRYSWECGALAIANQGDTVEDYCSWSRVAGEDLFFVPDADNVLPVLADEWFDDDIVAGIRQWLAHAYGEATLEQNVAWLEESLGKDLRSYLVKDFYADHLKTYQKRPIYWMFQSPKKSFQCLVYLHRYDEGTVGTILTGYLRPLQEKLRARLQVLESPGTSAADAREANKVRGMVAELEQWERDVIYPLAHERKTIDLDDGVKVNYNKFPRALAKVPGLSDWK